MLNLMLSSNFSGIKIAGSSQYNTLLKAVMSGLIRIILASRIWVAKNQPKSLGNLHKNRQKSP